MSTQAATHISSLYQRPHELFSIYLTNRCNLQCRHCGTNSGPSERSFLDLDGATMSALRTAIRDGAIRGLHVSGGEPFLRRDDLRKLAELAREAGILLGINTNGFWGTSLAAGVALLESMDGITELLLSTDEYHAEFLSPEKLITAARAGLECEMLVDVVTTTPGRRPTEFCERLETALAEAGILHRVRRLYQELGPSGRAEPIKEHVQVMSPLLPAGSCRQLGRPTLLENGSVLACCNTTMAKKCESSPLDLGRISQAPLAELLRRGRQDRILQALGTLGPAILAGALPPEMANDLPRLYPKNDICSLCSELMGHPQAVARLRHEVESGSLKNLLDAAVLLLPA
jgi:hypothetical protein